MTSANEHAPLTAISDLQQHVVNLMAAGVPLTYVPSWMANEGPTGYLLDEEPINTITIYYLRKAGLLRQVPVAEMTGPYTDIRWHELTDAGRAAAVQPSLTDGERDLLNKMTELGASWSQPTPDASVVAAIIAALEAKRAEVVRMAFSDDQPAHQQHRFDGQALAYEMALRIVREIGGVS